MKLPLYSVRPMLCSLMGSRRFAREQFESEVDQGRPDSQISLAKACLLIALEEEAAVEADLLQQKVKHLTPLHKAQAPRSESQDSIFQPEGPYRYAAITALPLHEVTLQTLHYIGTLYLEPVIRSICVPCCNARSALRSWGVQCTAVLKV